MAEEKKSPNLKDRLKRTQVGQAPPGGAVAPPGGGAPIMPPVSATASAGGDIMPPPSSMAPPGGGMPGIPGIPGLSGDVAPPAFVQQQQKADAAAARARAAAADPFAASSAPVHAAPQNLVIHMDNKEVADHEVGRTRSGTIVAVVLTGVIALGAGYAVGNLVANKDQERQTLQALTGVRTSIVSLGDTINQIKTHIDHAVEAGNITVAREGAEEGGAAAAPPTHPPDVDEQLLEWFRSQPSDVPFTPEVYAGRVGRLRSAVVSKLTLVTLQFTQAWTLLQQHTTRTNVASVRAALQAANPSTNEMSHMLVTFGRSSADAPPFGMLVSLAGQPAANGAIPIAGAGIPAGATRTPYAGGDITAATLTNIAFPVAPGQGLAAQAMAASVLPWRQYQQRVAEMKTLVDQLAQNHGQLLEALQGHSGG